MDRLYVLNDTACALPSRGPHRLDGQAEIEENDAHESCESAPLRERRVSATGSARGHVGARAVAIDPAVLSRDSCVLLLDTADAVYLWRGRSVTNARYQRARLFAERIMRDPRGEGNKSGGCLVRQLVEVSQGNEASCPPFASRFFSSETAAGADGDATGTSTSTDDADGTTSSADVDTWGDAEEECKVYEVKMGRGFLELPQVARRRGRVSQRRPNKSCLRSDGAFIIDDGADVFVWFGRGCSRIIQAAATKLVDQVSGHQSFALCLMFVVVTTWVSCLALLHR